MFPDSEYKDFRARVREFCEAEIAPNADVADVTQEFPEGQIKKLHEQGWLKILLPKEIGGMGYNTIQYSIIVEELSRVCGSTGLMIAAHNSLGTFPIYKFGDVDQHKRFLTPTVEEGAVIAFGLTEPGAGSDAGGTKSYAELKGDEYVLNGTKCWITSARLCKHAIVTARTDKSGGVKGISSFVLSKDMDGFTIGKKENKLGCRGSDTGYLHFDDVRVPVAHRIGEEGHGFRHFMITLDGGRISIAAMALGLAVGAFESAAKHAATYEENGKPIGYSEGIGFKLAEMFTRIEAARGLIYGASSMKDRGVPFGTQSAMAKLYASEVCNFCTSSALDIVTLEGVRDNHPATRMFRDMKLTEIGEGTSEIQRLVISRAIMKSVRDN